MIVKDWIQRLCLDHSVLLDIIRYRIVHEIRNELRWPYYMNYGVSEVI